MVGWSGAMVDSRFMKNSSWSLRNLRFARARLQPPRYAFSP
jgi:hypothetical protein